MKDWLSRRKLLQTIPAGAFATAPFAAAAAQSGTSPARPALSPLNRFPRMVQEYFVDQVRRVEETNLHRLAALKSKADAEAYVRSVREKTRQAFGPLPGKTPLNARVTGTLDRDAYRIEKVVFESRPDFLVTGNLYLPKGRRTPMPGVIGVCGHSDTGKAGDTYQSFAQGLARLGYICFLIDPIGQGERQQYPTPDFKIGPGVQEHLYEGNQQFLVDEFLGTWRAWDAIRALDYLVTRPEVDPRHIGVTGNSGGGTLTTWLCALEPRFTMAAASCFVTTLRRNLENELPADTEQCPPKTLALSLDHYDFIACMAPKPVLVLGQEKDFFDPRGLEEAYGRLKRIYTLLGAPDNIGLFIGKSYHGYTQENREAMYRWFNRATRVSDAKSEPALVLEKPEALVCTPKGQVWYEKSRSVYAFTREKAQALAQKRKPLSGEALVHAVSDALGIPSQQRTAPDYRILRPMPGRNFPKKQFAQYLVETERGVHAVVYRLSDEPLYSPLPKGTKRAVLYISDRSSDAELRSEPLVRELLAAEPESAFYTCDVRGIGESQPDTCGANMFDKPYGSDYFYAVHSIMLGRPYVGQRTYDVLRVVDLLAANGHSEIHVAGKKWGALPAAFAALLSPAVTQVTLKNTLTSYGDVATSSTYSWPLASLVPDVLTRFDLPDCYRALESKRLRMIEPVGANG